MKTDKARLIDYLIIGGGIAGTTAAETIRQKDLKGSVALINSEPYFLYSRVLLPAFIKDELSLDKIMLRTEDDYKRKNIDIYLGEVIENFDPLQMILKTKSGKSLEAKKILISSGGHPKPWPYELLTPKNIFRLQTLSDALRIKKFLSENRSGKALVIGGGFMALEFVGILVKAGFKTTLLIAQKSFWPNFLEKEGFEILADTWRKNNLEIIYEEAVQNIQNTQPGKPSSVLVETKNGRSLEVDFIGLGIGLKRNLDFLFPPAAAEGSPSWGIEVNECLESKFSNVWAAGDVAFYDDPFSGRKRLGGNWSGAFSQGRIAGLNMAGDINKFQVISTYSIRHLGLTITFCGDVGPFDAGFNVQSHCFYLNKASGEYVRVFEKDRRLIGAAMINGQNFLGKINQAIISRWDSSKIILD